MPSIILDSRTYHYSITRKFIRSINLYLQTRRSFIVTAPVLTPAALIGKFIGQHSARIVKNSQKFVKKSSLLHRRSLAVLEQKYDLIINQATKDSLVIFSEDQKIYLNTSRLTNAHLRQVLDTKMRPFALKLINIHLSLLSSEFGFRYHRVSVRNQSSRFGSCSAKNNLNFNWQIIFFPLDKFRHILLHELTHLEIKNHSSKFWRQLAIYDPDWKVNRYWLRKNGNKQFII